MPLAVHLALWAAVLLLIPFLDNWRWPWLEYAWYALLVVGFLLEFLNFVDYMRKRNQTLEEARRQWAEETRRRNKKLADEQAAQAAQEERERRERIQVARDSLKILVEAHAAELAARREELVKYGRYAIPDFSDWIAEKEFFANQVVSRNDPGITAALTDAEVLNSIDAVLDGRPLDHVAQHSADVTSSQTQPLESAGQSVGRVCPVCGHSVPASERMCPQCGASLDPSPAAGPSDGQNKGQETRYPSEASGQPRGDDRYDRTTSRLSTTSLLLAIPGVFLPGLGVFQVSALLVGIAALRRDSTWRPTGRWQAWVGTVLGAIYTLYFIVRFAHGYFGPN